MDEKVLAAVDKIKDRISVEPKVGVILGSGLYCTTAD